MGLPPYIQVSPTELRFTKQCIAEDGIRHYRNKRRCDLQNSARSEKQEILAFVGDVGKGVARIEIVERIAELSICTRHHCEAGKVEVVAAKLRMAVQRGTYVSVRKEVGPATPVKRETGVVFHQGYMSPASTPRPRQQDPFDDIVETINNAAPSPRHHDPFNDIVNAINPPPAPKASNPNSKIYPNLPPPPTHEPIIVASARTSINNPEQARIRALEAENNRLKEERDDWKREAETAELKLEGAKQEIQKWQGLYKKWKGMYLNSMRKLADEFSKEVEALEAVEEDE